VTKSIATQRGDDGYTSLLGCPRVSKSHLRVEACGSLDELTAILGLARAWCEQEEIKELVKSIQTDLFAVNASLANPTNLHPAKVTVARLTEQVHRIENMAGILNNDWSIAGEHPISAIFDLARTICRRAERNLVRLRESGEEFSSPILPYLNRLSDLLWLLGRWIELQAGL